MGTGRAPASRFNGPRPPVSPSHLAPLPDSPRALCIPSLHQSGALSPRRASTAHSFPSSYSNAMPCNVPAFVSSSGIRCAVHADVSGGQVGGDLRLLSARTRHRRHLGPLWRLVRCCVSRSRSRSLARWPRRQDGLAFIYSYLSRQVYHRLIGRNVRYYHGAACVDRPACGRRQGHGRRAGHGVRE